MAVLVSAIIDLHPHRVPLWMTNMWGRGTWLLVVLFLLLPVTVAAHEDPSRRIEALSSQIEENPNIAALLLKRGILHRLAGHYDMALRDFDRAAILDGSLREIDFQRGSTLLKIGQPALAKQHLDRYIVAFPNHSKALVLRAQALHALGNNMASAKDYTRAISRAPLPGHYVARARALAVDGHLAEAIKGLDGGMKKLGMVGALQYLAIELEVRRKNIAGAVTRVDTMAKSTGRADIWLARRGDILSREGLHADARVAYGQALAAIGTLSQRRQNSRIVRKLRTRLTTLLCQPAPTKNSAQLFCPKSPMPEVPQAVSKN